MKTVQVSVIIPNFNHAPYLEKRIDSVLNQTFQDFEVIILDDCSIDESRKIIENYRAHPKIRHIKFNESNSGSPFIQWKTGVALAKGEFVWIAESDDYADVDFLYEQVELLVDKPVALSYCDSILVDENEKHIGKISTQLNELFKTKKWDHAYYAKGIDELETCLIDACTILNVSSVVFRRTVLFEYLGNVIAFRSTGDWLLYMLACLEYDIIYTNKALNYFRMHATNTTKLAAKNGKSSFERFYSRRKVLMELAFKSELIPYSTAKSLKGKLLSKMKLELKFILSLCIRGKASFPKFSRAAYTFVTASSKV